MKLSHYLCSVVSYEHSTCIVKSQDILILTVPHFQTELGSTSFRYCVPHKCNELQKTMNDTFISIKDFKRLKYSQFHM